MKKSIKKLDELDERERRILTLILKEPGYIANLPYIVHKELDDFNTPLFLNYETLRRRYERAAKKLKEYGLIEIFKKDGLTWYSAIPEKVLEIIKNSQNPLKTEEKQKKQKRPSPLEIPKKASAERLKGINYLQKIKMINKNDDKVLRAFFDSYLQRINNQVIALINEENGELVGLEYSTRFNDQIKTLQNLNKYDYALEESGKRFYRAVFLTLTTDPKRFNNLWEASRSLGTSWNKFLSFLTKRFKKRPEYIAVNEFTKSGLIHIHAIIFVPFLIKKDEITKEWVKIGQAEINYIYALKNRSGKWVWASKKRPKNSEGDTGTYLKKYLKKALFSTRDGAEATQPLYMYWLINKRFWTSSRNFLPKSEKIEKEPSGWHFFKVMDRREAESDLNRILYYRMEPPDEKPISSYG